MIHTRLRRIALLLAIVLVCGALAGCGKREEETDATSAPETTAAPETTEAQTTEAGEDVFRPSEPQVEALETKEFDMDAFRANIEGLTKEQVYADNAHALFSDPIACQYGDYTLYLQKILGNLWGLVCRKNDGTQKRVLYKGAEQCSLRSIQCVDARTVLLQGWVYEGGGYPARSFIFYDLITGEEVDYPLPEAVTALENEKDHIFLNYLVFFDRGIFAYTRTYPDSGEEYASSYFINAEGEIHSLSESLCRETYSDGIYYYADYYEQTGCKVYQVDLDTMERTDLLADDDDHYNYHCEMRGNWWISQYYPDDPLVTDVRTGASTWIRYMEKPSIEHVSLDSLSLRNVIADGDRLYVYVSNSKDYYADFNGLYCVDTNTGDAQLIITLSPDQILDQSTIVHDLIYFNCNFHGDYITYLVSPDGSGLTMFANG